MFLCFVTNNKNKLNEISGLISREITLLSLKDIGCTMEIPEIHATIEDNSFAKADYIFRNYHIDCFADDTGLEVDALEGEPGVHSARYAGPGRNSEDNISLLLKKLENKNDRSASFKTVITLFMDGTARQFSGIIKGVIIRNRRGSHGFGYDSVFMPDGYQFTFAEMSMAQKNLISHRAIAIRRLVEYLNSIVKNRP